MDGSLNEQITTVDMGSGNYGCLHYRRRCKIRAPCCDEIFDCRHCHNDSKNSLEVEPSRRHDIPRNDIKRSGVRQQHFQRARTTYLKIGTPLSLEKGEELKGQVICSLCNTEQDVQQTCIRCGVCMGKYFCSKCNLFDDDVSKNQYHCDKCGICRTGGKENFFHCDTCGCCYSNFMRESHICIEKAMHHNCPICFEYIFDTTRNISILPCGHTMHQECAVLMEGHSKYSCPLCSRSVCDMSLAWENLDQEVASTPMPEMYQNKMVWILCNDCLETSEVNFHVLGLKCPTCKSYNTRQIRGGTRSCANNTETVS